MTKEIVFPVVRESGNPIEFIRMGFYADRKTAEQVAEEAAKKYTYCDVYVDDEILAFVDGDDVYSLTDKCWHGEPTNAPTKKIVFCSMYAMDSDYESCEIIDEIFEERNDAEACSQEEENEFRNEPGISEDEERDTSYYVDDRMAIIDGVDVYVLVGKLKKA